MVRGFVVPGGIERASGGGSGEMSSGHRQDGVGQDLASGGGEGWVGGWRRIWIGASRGGEGWFDSGLGFLDRRRMEDMG
jgi:hypothetical protein